MFKSGVFITKKSLDNVIARNEVTKQSTLTDEVSYFIAKSESCHKVKYFAFLLDCFACLTAGLVGDDAERFHTIINQLDVSA